MLLKYKWLIGVVGVLVVAGIIVGIVVPITLNNRKDFPDDFTFGAATSSYQIEGGRNADGKSDSIWDKVTREYPNLVAGRGNGDIAADSYTFYKEDVKAVKDSGVKNFKNCVTIF
jgi:beta-glucosidase/6-phospho-beta-glucosidase/beta-galactosidase